MLRLRMLSNLPVRQKVWGGFGILLALMLLLSAVAYRSLFQVEDGLSLVVEELQPTMLASQDLSQALARAGEALGLYMLTEEDSARIDYQQSLARWQHCSNSFRPVMIRTLRMYCSNWKIWSRVSNPTNHA